MSILLQKGLPHNSEYSSVDYPVLTADAAGSVSIYATYPGTPTFIKAMTRSGNVMVFGLTIAEILNLPTCVYTVVASITPLIGGETSSSLEYATVTDATVFTTPMTKLFMTMSKVDGTPAGRQTRILTNAAGSVTITLGWEGLAFSVSHAVADEMTGVIVDTETISTTTNAAGYAELYVIKGLTVSASCPGFGMITDINTTGLDEIDLATFFD